MKSAETIANGFPAGERNRARTLVGIAQHEGVVLAAFELEEVLYEHADLDDSHLVQLIGEWIKTKKK